VCNLDILGRIEDAVLPSGKEGNEKSRGVDPKEYVIGNRVSGLLQVEHNGVVEAGG